MLLPILAISLNSHGPRRSAGRVVPQSPQILNMVCVSGVLVGSGNATMMEMSAFLPGLTLWRASLRRVSETKVAAWERHPVGSSAAVEGS